MVEGRSGRPGNTSACPRSLSQAPIVAASAAGGGTASICSVRLAWTWLNRLRDLAARLVCLSLAFSVPAVARRFQALEVSVECANRVRLRADERLADRVRLRDVFRAGHGGISREAPKAICPIDRTDEMSALRMPQGSVRGLSGGRPERDTA